MKNKILILFIVLLLSCQKHKINDDIEVINLSKALDNVESIMLSQITDSIKYIRLETKKNCILTKISKLDIVDSLIVINNNKSNLLVFDMEGEFEREIGSMGRGPGEFLEVSNFFIDKDKSEVIIFDQNQKKIMKFDLFGNYLDEFTLDYYPIYVEWIGGRYYFQNIFRFANDSLICEHTDKKLKHTYSKKDLSVDNYKAKMMDKRISSFNDSVIYFNGLSNIVCKMKNGVVNNRYFFEFGKKEVDSKVYADEDINFNEKYRNHGFVDKFIETKDYIFINAIFDLNMKHILFDKNTKETTVVDNMNCDKNKLFNNFSFVNDLDGVINFWPDNSINDNELYRAFYAYNFKKGNYCLTNGDKFVENRSKLLEKFIDEAKYSDNPILMLIKLK